MVHGGWLDLQFCGQNLDTVAFLKRYVHNSYLSFINEFCAAASTAPDEFGEKIFILFWGLFLGGGGYMSQYEDSSM